MIAKIVKTTDGQSVGRVIDLSKPLVGVCGLNFHPTKVQDLGGGYYRYSNSNYVIEVKEIADGKDSK